MASAPLSLPGLIEDLEAEQAALDSIVAGLGEDSFDLATPAVPWAVRDQLSHLAYFDDCALAAVTDPDGFRRFAAAAIAAGGDPMAPHLERGRAMSGPEVLTWWRGSRRDAVTAARSLSAADRIPWFGPDMGALSFVSARLMETWAHGLDVADALGVVPAPTARLRHVAHLGVKARPFSYAVHGVAMPASTVHVELTSPAGEQWTWDADAATEDAVRGSALDFCLVVTQRRHLDDTALVVEGPLAQQWMSIAQAFAGPPGSGRAPSSASAHES
jgi:uncharacterized protein (TIGR03084 family)